MNPPDPRLAAGPALDAAPPGSAALVLPVPPRAASAVLHLLSEAAAQGGGRALALPGRAMLVGVAPAVARRAAGTLGALLGRPAPALHLLPDAAPTLREAWAAPPAPAPSGARCRLLLDAAGTPRAQYLHPAEAPDHAGREAARRRLLAALADPAGRAALPALRPGLRLFLACPAEAPAGAAPRGGSPDDPAAPVAVLPLAALWPAEGFLARVEGLRAAGWQPGLGADDPAALDWMPEGPWRLAPPGDAPPARPGPRLVLLGPRPAWAPPDALHAA